ncbi:MTAP family purine nucleoside phosphorylase [Glycomyces tritici]|uniref:Purine nucleoside phosphorylase n=1 Tax=Glycomyces tritici TaxID=2665176 RepID=A0ABT7YWF2_9ACTN|nr:MTAP family purine nucleoside phosphorylase [Glycomyces tritici]MDN3242948.1 MTAP family purine nucleoside phosphorylase [Glycomyces tritici]
MNETPPRADIGVFGGSGFYSLTAEAETVEMRTEWGPPSAPVAIAAFGTARVAFLPRHGAGHRHPPHRVNYRANVDAMRQLGVRALISPFAAGSLRPEIRPGEFVVCDQLVDRTWGRESTFHDEFHDGPVHVPFAEPYDPRLRRIMLDAAAEVGAVAHDGGTVVVVNGPRFSTRAESRWHRDSGWHVVNMTQSPEAPLAMEAGIPFVGIALVTDYDAGLDEDPGIEPVSQDAVFAVFEANLHKVRELLDAAIPRLAR